MEQKESHIHRNFVSVLHRLVRARVESCGNFDFLDFANEMGDSLA